MQKHTRYIAIGVTFFFLLLTVVKSYRLTTGYAGGDLRTRVVGARLLGTKHSPYFYKWHPGDGTFFLDTWDVPGRIVNGNVVTPATLYIMYPLSQLAYDNIKIVWSLLQSIAALATLLLLLKRKNLGDTTLQWIIILTGIVCSTTFLYNIERGQMYIFYTMVFALMFRCYFSSWKQHEFVSGFIGGLFILFRPFAGIMGLGFLLAGKVKWIAGCATGFIIGCTLFVLPQPSLWQDYFSAMQEYVKENTEQSQVNVQTEAPPIPGAIAEYSHINTSADFELERLDTAYHLLKRFNITITSTQSAVLYVILLAVLSAFFYRKKKPGTELIFLFGFLAYMMAEQFVLAPRAAYNVIQWLFPLTLISIRARNNLPVMLVLITALLLLHDFPIVFPFQKQLAELLFFGLTIFVIFFEKGPTQQQPGYDHQ